MERLYKMNEGLNQRFPGGDNPFQIITRLAEECGELAAEVNHWEGSGVKRQKHGEPDPAKLAKEVMDVLRCALQIAMHYGIQAELETAVQQSYTHMLAEGLIDE
ncbi:MAG: hypothetical protein KJ069_09890 [Anaerolineae bacterium]|nr:hypothetical protein [Anaerolineae bacterium]